MGVRGYQAIVAGDHAFSMEYRWKLFSLGSSPKDFHFLSHHFLITDDPLKDPFFYESDQTLMTWMWSFSELLEEAGKD